jgi:hypothetical protein
MITITVAPVGATVSSACEPGHAADVRYGYFSHRHVVTLAQMRKEYARVGLDVIDYRIGELIS